MRMRSILILLCCSLTFVLKAQETQRQMGPVITDFGPVFSVENPDFVTDTNKVYKVIFDIHNTPDDPAKVNQMLNTLARFLNMHAQAGVPLENLKVAGVFHNKATHDVLNNSEYQAKYKVPNPNLRLLKALEEIDKVHYGLESGLSGDLMAIDIRQALYHFGEITGETTTDDLLGNIFANFCIGK